MEILLQSLSLGLLLRSLFAGGFFVLSFWMAAFGRSAQPEQCNDGLLTEAILVALFSGVVMYGIHRSIIYPFIEFILDSKCIIRFRESRLTLIRRYTITCLLARWARAAGSDGPSERAKHISHWADFAHLQYVSALCIGAGAVVARAIYPKQEYVWSGPLVAMAITLTVAALVSDWRLRVVESQCRDDESLTQTGRSLFR